MSRTTAATLRRAGWRVGSPALVVLMLTTGASAQTPSLGTPPPGNIWSHGTTLNLFAGAAWHTSENAAPMAGGAIGWQVVPRFGLEGSASWLDFGHGADSFAASLKGQFTLVRTPAIAPFLQGGIGLYRAVLDSAQGTIPDFYQHRMSLAPGLRQTFTDPSFVAGGGVNFFLSRHLALRPDIETTIVIRDSRTFIVTSAALHFAYRFEDHPVTP